MKSSLKFLVAVLAMPFAVATAQKEVASLTMAAKTDAPDKDTSTAVARSVFTVKPLVIQNLRPADTRGLFIFEAPKNDGVPYTGFKLDWGAAFQQDFQALVHTNLATPVMVAGVNTNQLVTIGKGFNTANANLSVNAQVAPGIRLAMTSYLSSRHHNETWVKDGYALLDASPIDLPIFNTFMKYATIKVGHFEVNYGDQHFRRSDNGNGFYNPFVGNLITDAFTTEIGGELYLRAKGFMVMASVTGGEIKGDVTKPKDRDPAYIGKLGWDKQVTNDLRLRLTTSAYRKDKSASNTLFTGDRAGSKYFLVMENTAATTSAQAWSGLLRPSFGYRVNAYVVNPFIKYRGLELFGTAETATGKSAAEARYHTWRQFAGEGVYRFWDDKLFAGYRYNQASGRLSMAMPGDVMSNRYQIGAGWYLNPMMLTKVEIMRQRYYGFPTNDIRYGGRIHGFMVETALAF